jgi:hypothetical protein
MNAHSAEFASFLPAAADRCASHARRDAVPPRKSTTARIRCVKEKGFLKKAAVAIDAECGWQPGSRRRTLQATRRQKAAAGCFSPGQGLIARAPRSGAADCGRHTRRVGFLRPCAGSIHALPGSQPPQHALRGQDKTLNSDRLNRVWILRSARTGLRPTCQQSARRPIPSDHTVAFVSRSLGATGG